jgi:Family of unknown function (DUF6882)
MQERNDAWIRDFGLSACQYEWTLDNAQICFKSSTAEVEADLCVVGSISECEGTFLWAWANKALPPKAWQGLERVRTFGESNALELLITPEWPGGRAEGLEMAAVSARLLDGAGVWIDGTADVTLFFVLSCFRERSVQP